VMVLPKQGTSVALRLLAISGDSVMVTGRVAVQFLLSVMLTVYTPALSPEIPGLEEPVDQDQLNGGTAPEKIADAAPSLPPKQLTMVEEKITLAGEVGLTKLPAALP